MLTTASVKIIPPGGNQSISKLLVFVSAGQSNMGGQGQFYSYLKNEKLAKIPYKRSKSERELKMLLNSRAHDEFARDKRGIEISLCLYFILNNF